MKKIFLTAVASCSLAFGLTVGGNAFSTSKQVQTAQNSNNRVDLLVKLDGAASLQSFQRELNIAIDTAADYEAITDRWVRVQGSDANLSSDLAALDSVAYVQPNYKLHSFGHPNLAQLKSQIEARLNREVVAPNALLPDNPAIPAAPASTNGADPKFSQQWGMQDGNVEAAWRVHRGSPEMIVAVIDTGVDYTHEDLLPNLWRNPGEVGQDAQGRDKSSNGVDDDGNGFIDDVVGWDFASKDNKPYDLSSIAPLDILNGVNPGHGTHCAGNVAARGGNGKGISGVAPDVKIMSLRFITEQGSGTTADAVSSIHYAVDNGAKVLSNSWGGEDDPNSTGEENLAMREAVEYSESKGALFVAAAGNGRNGRGYNMDNDPKPVIPAAYAYESIVTVAAMNKNSGMGGFSNYGRVMVDLGAPGVDVFSTTVKQNYSNVVVDYLGIRATWDGTSMATPHVAGAAALYWSKHPEKTFREVKQALFASVKAVSALQGKTVTGGKLDVEKLMNQR